MVHTAAGYARHEEPPLDAGLHVARSARARPTWSPARRWRRSTGCPCCCCPATCSPPAPPAPVLQELEDPSSYDVSVNDCFRPVSRFFDRINRPEQLRRALLAAMRVLTDPAETGAVTLALPQDVQAEAYDWPEELFEQRVWRVRRPVPEPEVLARAAELLRGARAPADRRRRRHDLRRGDRGAARARRGDRDPGGRDAGRQGLAALRPSAGASARSAPPARPPPTPLAREADVVLGVGTRWSDFTTASRSAVRRRRTCASSTSTSPPSTPPSTPGCRWSPTRGAGSRRWPRRSTARRCDARRAQRLGRDVVERAYSRAPRPARPERGDRRRQPRQRPARRRRLRRGQHARRPAQAVAHARPQGLPRRVRLLVHGLRDRRRAGREDGRAGPRGVRAGRRRLLPDDGPGARDRDRRGLQARRSCWSRTTATHRSARSRSRSARSASARSTATAARTTSCRSTWPPTPPASAPTSARTTTIDDFEAALREAAASPRTTVVQVETDPLIGAPSSEAWWDVPVAEVAELETTRAAREQYEQHKRTQKQHLSPGERVPR